MQFIRGLLYGGLLAAVVASTAHANMLINPNGDPGGSQPQAETDGLFPTNLFGYENPATLIAVDAGLYTFSFLSDGDASFLNTFTVNNAGCSGGPITTANHGNTISCNFAANTTINFSYTTNSGADTLNSGDANHLATTGLGYLMAFPGGTTSPGTTTGTTLYIGLSDGASLDLPPPTGRNGDFQDLDIVVSEVPEPASMGLLGIGLIGMAFARNRRARSSGQ